MSTYTDASLIVTPNAVKSGKLYSLKGTDLDVVRATSATYVGADGLIKTALANVPRLDYTNGSCPSILVEPQRTNLVLRSEEFDNATWTKINLTITANATISPSGTMTADKLVENNTNSPHYTLQSTGSLVVGNTYFVSIYLKDAGRNRGRIRVNGAFAIDVEFNLQNGTVSQANAIIQNMGNGWYRVGFSFVANATTMSTVIWLSNSTTGNSGFNYTYLGDNTSGLFLWGAQLEAGSNATSYIPTVASAATRNADVISKSGISSLIGQTQGTLYCEIDHIVFNQNTGIYVVQNNADQLSNRIGFRYYLSTGILNAFIRTGSNFVVDLDGILPVVGQKYKMCFTYNQTEQKFFINGVLVNSRTGSYTQPATLNQVQLGNMVSNSAPAVTEINAGILFPTVLTNTQAIQLTTL